MQRKRRNSRIHSDVGTKNGKDKISSIGDLCRNDSTNSHVVCPLFDDEDCQYCSPIIDYQVRKASNIFNKLSVTIREFVTLGSYCNNACKPCDEMHYCPKLWVMRK